MSQRHPTAMRKDVAGGALDGVCTTSATIASGLNMDIRMTTLQDCREAGGELRHVLIGREEGGGWRREEGGANRAVADGTLPSPLLLLVWRRTQTQEHRPTARRHPHRGA